jgi:peptidyl-prolyl cis-trans isomerase D
MLNSLRNASRTFAAKILLLMLVVSFGVWGVSASMVGGNQNSVLSVGDQNVTPQEFTFAYQRQLSDLSRQFGTRLTTEQAKAFGIDRQVFGQLAAGASLDELASQMNLGLSQDRLAQLIAEDPAFKSVNGQFDRNIFRERLRTSGLREDDYIVERSKVAVRGQIIDAVTGGFTAPKTLTDAMQQYRNEQRDIEYLLLSNANIGLIAAPKDEVLTPWFEQNKARYRAPEYRKFSYVTLQSSDLADLSAVTDTQVSEYYEANKARFRTAGRRTIEQIVFPNKEMAEAAAGEVRAGTTTFDQVILDQGKKPADVLLGEFTKDTVPDSAIAEPAFAITREGGLTPVVDGAFGPVLVRVTNIREETVKSLDESRDEIRQDIANAAAADEVNNVHDRYEDLRGGGSNLVDAAKELNLKSVVVEAIDAGGLDMNEKAVADLPAPTLVTEVFKTEPNTEAMAINIGNDGYLWFEVIDVIEARDRTLDEVRTEVVADWTAEQQRVALSAKADELKERLEKGEDFAAIATEMGLAVESKLGIRRFSSDAVIGEQVVNAVFKGAEGLISHATDAEGSNRILFKVTKVDTSAAPEAGNDSDGQITALATAAGDDILDQMVNRLQADYGVSINQAAADAAMIAY